MVFLFNVECMAWFKLDFKLERGFSVNSYCLRSSVTRIFLYKKIYSRKLNYFITLFLKAVMLIFVYKIVLQLSHLS
jgi:hypothetical protein